MTITRTIGQYHDASNSRIRKIGQLTGGTYATGGEALSAADLGMGRIEVLLVEPFDNGSAIYLGVYQVASGLMKLYDPTTGAEVANGTDLSAFNARFEAIGL